MSEFEEVFFELRTTRTPSRLWPLPFPRTGPGRTAAESRRGYEAKLTPELLGKKISKLEKEMRQAAQNLEFEKAAKLRDEVRSLREQLLVRAA